MRYYNLLKTIVVKEDELVTKPELAQAQNRAIFRRAEEHADLVVVYNDAGISYRKNRFGRHHLVPDSHLVMMKRLIELNEKAPIKLCMGSLDGFSREGYIAALKKREEHNSNRLLPVRDKDAESKRPTLEDIRNLACCAIELSPEEEKDLLEKIGNHNVPIHGCLEPFPRMHEEPGEFPFGPKMKVAGTATGRIVDEDVTLPSGNRVHARGMTEQYVHVDDASFGVNDLPEVNKPVLVLDKAPVDNTIVWPKNIQWMSKGAPAFAPSMPDAGVVHVLLTSRSDEWCKKYGGPKYMAERLHVNPKEC